jgi:hypothetical protein
MSNIKRKYKCLGPVLGYTYQWNNICSGVYFQLGKKMELEKFVVYIMNE